MKASARKMVLLNCITLFFFLVTTFSYGAVFQEPVAENPETFKTRHLFSEGFISSYGNNINLPETSGVKSTVPAIVIDKKELTIEKNVLSELGLPRIKAAYVRPSLASVQEIMKKYKSIPGGVTLEGTGKGLEKIRKVSFDKTRNIFILNDELTYNSPVSSREMKEILKAISIDDRIGVSLGDQVLVYGALSEGSIPCINLKLTDHFLGCIVFANNRWVRRFAFPEGYKPKRLTRFLGGGYAVYFNLDDYEFVEENGSFSPEASTLTITLIPLTNQKDEEGGYLPDFAKITSGGIPREFEGNASHIVNNISYYRNDPRLQKVIAYGQAAAFARSLKDNNVSLDELIEKL